MDRKPVLITSMILISIPLLWNFVLLVVALSDLSLPLFMYESRYLGSAYGWLQGAIPFLGYLGGFLIAYALLFCEDN